ncbi:2-pyrone-4,6-dicarboxylate hydrolase [Paenibacillus sp. FSL R7-0273]|uniref:amidohydrolase family protein n=1 Tax=Paenibacillus sp. FSL R7-0273 TaxID=1536772 RepID=UPI0004F75EC0|nr:amidohydrolase family protein [Paenibacillus sp. FSL R7-0273]AIQ47723.1 2-pyrone-4,6-dicarboxylate hydrolase [Paenibacillus sp. FSL R7-0273]OMF94725.1 2-pyrone-4,6-dicarboxylate hydrolase [Paenibacillus sp. FSL R7-0273]
MRTAFDAHMHIIDPRFPLIENQGYLPDAFTCRNYLDTVRELKLIGGAVVSGSFQGFDQTYLIDALQSLGPGFVGVTQLPHDTTDEELLRLHSYGVRAVRFNVRRGGSEDLSQLDYMARRVHEIAGWHTELYIDSVNLPDIAPVLAALPAVSIDHLGLSQSGFHHLLDLVDTGVRVKATGFGRVELDVPQALRAIAAVNPDALMFGTDLPSTRARRPYQPSDIELIYDTLGEELADKVLFRNASDWYLK